MPAMSGFVSGSAKAGHSQVCRFCSRCSHRLAFGQPDSVRVQAKAKCVFLFCERSFCEGDGHGPDLSHATTKFLELQLGQAGHAFQTLASAPLCCSVAWQVSVVHSEGSLVDAVEEGFAAMHARLETQAEVLHLCGGSQQPSKGLVHPVSSSSMRSGK